MVFPQSRVPAATGHCDQARLIDEFRTIAGTTPLVFMTELGDSVS